VADRGSVVCLAMGSSQWPQATRGAPVRALRSREGVALGGAQPKLRNDDGPGPPEPDIGVLSGSVDDLIARHTT
jgi:hypothetical protein